MAGWKESSWKKAVILVGGGAALSATAYFLYQHFHKRSLEAKDEGFEDVKADDSPEKKVLVLGLDGAGKSSILANLSKQDSPTEAKPTEGFNVMCVQTEKVSLNIWEIGGATKMRKYWNNFIQDTIVLVFVVDSTAVNRLPEAFDELHGLLGDERLRTVPIVIVANKQDLPNAQPPTEILHAMGLDNTGPKDHQVHTIGTQIPPTASPKGVAELEKLLVKLSS